MVSALLSDSYASAGAESCATDAECRGSWGRRLSLIRGVCVCVCVRDKWACALFVQSCQPYAANGKDSKLWRQEVTDSQVS